LVGLLARVDPVRVDIHRLGQVVDGRLEVLQTHSARNEPHVSLPVELDFADPFVIAERAVELSLERFDVLLGRGRLPLRLSLAHRLLYCRC